MGILFLLPFFAWLAAHPAGNCRLPMFVQTASPCVWNLHILRLGNPHKYGLFKGVVAKRTFCACFYVIFSSLSHAPKRPFHGQLRNCFTKFSRFRNGKKKGIRGGDALRALGTAETPSLASAPSPLRYAPRLLLRKWLRHSLAPANVLGTFSGVPFAGATVCATPEP